MKLVDTDVEKLIADSTELLENGLGRKLRPADPISILLKCFLTIIEQQRAQINDAGLQNLLSYARGENLEALGRLVGVERQGARAAFCTAEVRLSAARDKATVVSAGVRFNAGDEVHFALTEDVIFSAGEVVKTARAECLTAGELGNGYKPGELKSVVDYSPYLLSIINTTLTEGGGELEDDDSLRERIRLAPSSFSVAGSVGAYEFWAKKYSTDIIDVEVDSPDPGVVDVYILLEHGLPGSEMLSGLQSYLSADNIRPLTDYVRVRSPEIVDYAVNVRYWISLSDKIRAGTIIDDVSAAVDSYIEWQGRKLGRDINPTELTHLMRVAGAKRVEVISPAFEVVRANAIGKCSNIAIDYCGMEVE